MPFAAQIYFLSRPRANSGWTRGVVPWSVDSHRWHSCLPAAMKQLLVLFLMVYSASAAEFLLFCNPGDYGYQYYCGDAASMLLASGHNVLQVQDRELTTADFVGIDVLWDITLQLAGQTPACGSVWGGTTEPAVTAFLDSGGSWFAIIDNTSFQNCAAYKLGLITNYVVDALTYGGRSSASPCTIVTTATLGPEEDAVVTTPNAIGGTAISCAVQGAIDGVSPAHVLVTDGNGEATGIVYGGASTSTDAGFIVFGDSSWSVATTHFDEAQNYAAYLASTSSSVLGGDPHILAPMWRQPFELHLVTSVLHPERTVGPMDVILIDTGDVSVVGQVRQQSFSGRYYFTDLIFSASDESISLSSIVIDGHGFASISQGSLSSFSCGDGADFSVLPLGHSLLVELNCNAPEMYMANRGLTKMFHSHATHAQAYARITADAFTMHAFYVQKDGNDLEFGFFDASVHPYFGAEIGGLLNNVAPKDRSASHDMQEILAQSITFV
mmetsp:Transcript_18153/g.70163  ORF Transcript_18153/g.70163 Transcript_18153/m.70163 type:complete len:496 (+) Transcript_18153:2297-3784(+)